MSLVPLVDKWIQESRARARRGLSPRSEIAYRQDVAALARRIADGLGYLPADHPDPANAENLAKAQLGRITVEDLTAGNVEAVVSVLVAEGKAAATRARMLAAWRSFAAWLVRRGHLPADPTLELQTPARDERLPVAFSHAQLSRIVEAAACLEVLLRAGLVAKHEHFIDVVPAVGYSLGLDGWESPDEEPKRDPVVSFVRRL